jgi:hypothetical protein
LVTLPFLLSLTLEEIDMAEKSVPTNMALAGASDQRRTVLIATMEYRGVVGLGDIAILVEFDTVEVRDEDEDTSTTHKDRNFAKDDVEEIDMAEKSVPTNMALAGASDQRRTVLIHCHSC